MAALEASLAAVKDDSGGSNGKSAAEKKPKAKTPAKGGSRAKAGSKK